MQVNDKGFIICPLCGRQTKTKVLPSTVLKDFPLWCPWCRNEVVVAKSATTGNSSGKPNS